MTDKVYYEDAGKGSHRRKEDKRAFESGFDAIDWSVKEEAPTLRVSSLSALGSSGTLVTSGTIVNGGGEFTVDETGSITTKNLVVATSSEGQ